MRLLPFFIRSNNKDKDMKSHTEYIWFNTKKHREYINITSQVEEILAKRRDSGRNGSCLGYAYYSRCIRERCWNGTHSGYRRMAWSACAVQAWIPASSYGETNGDSHLKSLLIHHEVIVPVTNGSLDFGPWQQIYYAEFDGQRRKTAYCKSYGRMRDIEHRELHAVLIWKRRSNIV